MPWTKPCQRCGSMETRIEIIPNGPHYAKELCMRCGVYIRWIAKPGNLKPKRQKSHTDLVEKYSRGFCEICGILQSRIPNNETMEAHHVVEYQSDGDRERENIEIVCTACHNLIHWRRTYLHHLAPECFYAVDESTDTAKDPETMDSVEDGPPW